MSLSRVLVMVGEVLSATALVAEFAIPTKIIFAASRRPDFSVAVPLHWLVPMLCMIGAGVLSGVALLSMYWKT